MKHYDNNVSIVMEFLKSDGYSASVISMHRICYSEFRNHLLLNRKSFSPEIAKEWIESNLSDWNYKNQTGWRLCINQLDDVFKYGQISKDHIGPHASAYKLLTEGLKQEVDEFLEQGLSQNDIYKKPANSTKRAAGVVFYLLINLDFNARLKFHNEMIIVDRYLFQECPYILLVVLGKITR